MRLGLSTLSIRKPTQEELDSCAEAASRRGPNHLLGGASQALQPPQETHFTRISDGWIEDYDAAKVGEGREAYLSAKQAIQSWQHMSLGWVDTNRPKVRLGSSVCIAAKMLCFWQRNPLQIAYVREDATSHDDGRKGYSQGRSFGFGQTTLKGHALAGEESFTVRWKPDDSVWYEVYAFSRAKTALAVIAYPLRRFFQRKFRRDSARKVAATVQQTASVC